MMKNRLVGITKAFLLGSLVVVASAETFAQKAPAKKEKEPVKVAVQPVKLSRKLRSDINEVADKLRKLNELYAKKEQEAIEEQIKGTTEVLELVLKNEETVGYTFPEWKGLITITSPGDDKLRIFTIDRPRIDNVSETQSFFQYRNSKGVLKEQIAGDFPDVKSIVILNPKASIYLVLGERSTCENCQSDEAWLFELKEELVMNNVHTTRYRAAKNMATISYVQRSKTLIYNYIPEEVHEDPEKSGNPEKFRARGAYVFQDTHFLQMRTPGIKE